MLLWIVSPFPAVGIWGFVKLVLFYQWGINEDIRGRYEGAAPLSAWLSEWWHQGWWVIVVGIVGFMVVLPLYGWATIATLRLIFARPKTSVSD